MPPDHLPQAAERIRLLHRELTGQIIGAFYSVYRELGGGFAESVYEAALEKELARLVVGSVAGLGRVRREGSAVTEGSSDLSESWNGRFEATSGRFLA